MPYLLNLVYLLLAVCAAPWLIYSAVRKGKYREGWGAKLWGQVPRRTTDGPCVWLHAVSVGEVNLLQPILAELRSRRPDWDFVISTTTRTGFALARKKYAPLTVCYCPLDFSWAVRRALRRVRPDLLVLAELELWPNLIRAARRQRVPIAIVNGRLSAHSFRGYRRIRWLIARVLRQLSLVAVQNAEYGERFQQLGASAESLCVTGSIKFDGAESERRNPHTRRLGDLWQLNPDSRVVLAGSTQAPEESLVLAAFRELLQEQPDWRLVLVPRHPERFDEVAALIEQSGLVWQRRSQLDQAGADPQARVLLVDVVGELDGWWGTARIGFVGGSLGRRGGQNMIEPAAYGVAVCFGPNTWNFRDVVALLLNQQAACVVRDQAELAAFFGRCATEPAFVERLGQAARDTVQAQQGATRRTVDRLIPLVT